MKIALVGSRSYVNKERIKQVIEKYVSYYDNPIFVSGGARSGADLLAKEIVLELGLQYQEFPPKHFCHNKYCVMPSEQYNKAYHVSNFFERNTQIAEYVDCVNAFIVEGVPAKGTMDTVGKAEKLGKKVMIFNDK